MQFTYKEINNFLSKNNINITSEIADTEIYENISSLNNSNNNDLTFYNNPKYLEFLKNTKAKSCLIKSEDSKYLPSTCYAIFVNNPYLAFALLTNLIYKKQKSNSSISKKSTFNNTENIGRNVQIDHNVVIYENTYIGNNCIIMANSVIGPNVTLGDDNIIYPNNTISNLISGNNNVIQSGCVIGDQGFGFTVSEKIQIIHIGNVTLGNNIQIGSNTTIDRAVLDSTIISDNVRIDNLVQIAHNVSIDMNTIIAAQVGIAGSTKIGSHCIIGGQAGISGHLIIGNYVKIAAKSGVTKNINDNMTIAGFPAIEIKKWKKNIIKFNKF